MFRTLKQAYSKFQKNLNGFFRRMFSSESSGNDDFVSPFFFSFYFVEVDDNADVRAQARGMITSLSFSDPILRVHRDTHIYIYIYTV